MERIVKVRIWHRITAIFLAFVIVMGVFPIPTLEVAAEEEGKLKFTSENVEIEALNAVYTGEEQDLITKVNITKDGYEDYISEKLTAKINLADIKEITITANDLYYQKDNDGNGIEQELVTLDGELQEGDTVAWYVNDNEYKFSDENESITSDVPKASAIGEYTVKLVVNRTNYNPLTLTETVNINPPLIDYTGLSITGVTSTYTGKPQEAVTVTYSDEYATNSGYTLYYQLGTNEDDFNKDDWKTDIPTVTAAGSYVVWVKAVQGNYSETEIRPDDEDAYPYPVLIKKSKRNFEFINTNYNSVKVTTNTLTASELKNKIKNTFDFSAKLVTDEENANDEKILVDTASSTTNDTFEISYKVTLDDAYKDIATISEDGILTVFGAGEINVTAILSGDDNYEDSNITHTLIVNATHDEENSYSEFIQFISEDGSKLEALSYVLGATEGKTGIVAEKGFAWDTGSITYSILDEADSTGFSIDETTGNINVKNYGTVVSNIENSENNIYALTIQANKEKDTYYSEDFTTYTLNVTLSEPENLENLYGIYDISDTNFETDLDKANGNNGWYTTAVSIKSRDGYKIIRADDNSLESNNPTFNVSVTFGENGTDQGENVERAIYLKNTTTGEITKKVITSVTKLDTVSPNMEAISFPDTNNQSNNDKYYNTEIKVTFTATDATSGVDYFEWNYHRVAGSSNSILAEDSGIVAAKLDTSDSSSDSNYTATITLPTTVAAELKQLRGTLTVSAVDKAGNKSNSLDSDGVFIIDNIAPELNVEYKLENYNLIEDRYYVSDAVTFTFTLKEANFFEEDRNIVSISKDGSVAVKQTLEWQSTDNPDEYVTTLTLSEDAAYVISIDYTDRSGNKMESYQSATIVIDTTAPVIEFDYHTYDESNPQSATISIKERNFSASDIEFEVISAVDIAGATVALSIDLQEYLKTCEWTTMNDVHTAMISEQFADAIYDLKINYKDLAENAAEECHPETFVVDRTVPDVEKMSVSYSASITEKILSLVTLGFYQSDVMVSFVAYDDVSGVDYFLVDYQRQDGASTTNVESYSAIKVEATQDSSDKKKFTGSLKLPQQTAQQLRGSIGFTSTDTCSNTSNKLTDSDYVIVVDNIAPTITVEYNTPDNTENNKNYYKQSLTATLTVTEANFFEEDVVVKLQKNDGNFSTVDVTWTNASTDIYKGTYTIDSASSHTNDGDYVFSVEYKDKSNNQMTSYTSDIKVIDTTLPEIKVTYSSSTPSNTLTDSEGHNRKYFSSVLTATVTIIEHNFSSTDVKFMMEAKNVAGSELNIDSFHKKSDWKSDGDNHTITITYPGDANYTFDIEYTDLAKLDAADYAIDYFTVDTTTPNDLEISYSNSILDTILDVLSFGFYNAKTTVTIQATDETSSIYSFKYSYVNADGVSSVNAELVDIMIEEADITYSNSGTTGTAIFDIPKDVLGNNNQFNGNVNFTASDRSNNESDYLKDTKRIVVDNIAPTATIQYNVPVQEVNGISYYDGEITATITVNEANFYPEDVNITVTRDGAASTIEASWTDQSTDVHIGTFTLTGDADYTVEITYTDKSSNAMEQYISPQMTIDTEIVEATITINGQAANGMAFKDDVIPAISFEDKNFESYKVTLLRTSFAEKNVDVTEKFISGHVKTDVEGGSGSFDTFEKNQENDGIYILTVELNDKAGHTAETTTTFTVNRYGSVYVYNDYLVSLIKDGGVYVQSVSKDLVITEYNPDRLLNNSLDIEISKDGKPLDESKYTVSPEINEFVGVGQSGWFQYEYVIDKENFDSDGVYKVAVSSKDATGNSPENISYDDKEILFRVDSTAPEITSIIGLEEDIINATEQKVKYSVFDTMGLKSIIVYVNQSEVAKITDFEDDINNYVGDFKLAESSSVQKVRIVVTDMAGNVTDTASDRFTSSYIFNDSVTVSTNALIRWYANKTLFYGSIAGCSATFIGGTAAITLFRRRKLKLKNMEEQS